MWSQRRAPAEAGQAAVEAAIVLPLTVFLVLGSLQLSLVLQARLMAELAVFRAVRAGSINFGDCAKMTHTALVALLPTITRARSGGELAEAFFARRGNRYRDGSPVHSGPIIELVREQPVLDPGLLPGAPSPFEDSFDQPGQGSNLELRMLYWYRLRVPFADWVIHRMFLAHFGLKPRSAVDPLAPARARSEWLRYSVLRDEGWPGGNPGDNMVLWGDQGHYLVPIRVNAAMRMMTPPKAIYFPAPECPL